MEINLNFNNLDQLVNKLIAEREDKDDILDEYESLKEDFQEVLDNQLDSLYGIVSDYDEVDDTVSCGCDVTIEMHPLSSVQSNDVKRIHIQYCDMHDNEEKPSEAIYREWATKYAEYLWLASANNKNDYRYRELFEITGV